MTAPRVLVAGGGLAGMVAALRLAELGCAVELAEAKDRLGGRAGSDQVDGRYEDHAYHIAFPWYANFLRLATEVGARGDLIESPAYHQLVAGEFPRYRPYRAVGASVRGFVRGLGNGVLPWSDGLLYFYFILDSICAASRLLGRPDRTVDAHLTTRWYATPAVRRELDRIFVTGHGTPTDRFSLHTWLKFLPSFAAYRSPMYWIPRRSLEEALIRPLVHALRARGVSIRTRCSVERVDAVDGKVSTASASTPDGVLSWDVDQLVLALPADVVSEMKGDAVDQAGLDRHRLRALTARPVSALHLYFRHRIPALPTEHVSLVGSRFSLSFIDVARTRPDLPGSCLNIVIGAPGELLTLPRDRVVAAVTAELARYLPGLDADDIRREVWRPNIEEPLFSNEVSSWSDRPGTETLLANMFLAGDYVRSFVDVASMEGAVVTGLLAADAIRASWRPPAHPLTITRLPTTAGPATHALRALLAPAAAVAYLLSPSRREG